MTNAQSTYSRTPINYWDSIDTINKTLDDTVVMATSDFFEMCNLLKNCNVKDDDLLTQISTAVRELQHIDFFRQKLGHVRELHQELLRDSKIIGIDEKKKLESYGLIFKLNYHQLLAAHEEYIKVVLSVQTTIRKIKEHNILLINYSAPIFPNRFQIDDNFRNLSTSLSALMDAYVCSEDADFSWMENNISSRYTMEGERVVLQWCLKQSGSEEEFMEYYKINSVIDSVELF